MAEHPDPVVAAILQGINQINGENAPLHLPVAGNNVTEEQILANLFQNINADNSVPELNRFMHGLAPLIVNSKQEQTRVQAEIDAGTIPADAAQRMLQEAAFKDVHAMSTSVGNLYKDEFTPLMPWVIAQKNRQCDKPLSVRTDADDLFTEFNFQYPPSDPARCNQDPNLQRFSYMFNPSEAVQVPAYVQMFMMSNFLSIQDVGRLDSAICNKLLRPQFLVLLCGTPSLVFDAYHYKSLTSFRWVAKKGIAIRHYDPDLFEVREGETPVIWACKTNEHAIAALLLKLTHGKDVNTPSVNVKEKIIPAGYPIHFAANTQSVPLVRALLAVKGDKSKGIEPVNPSVIDGLHRTALHLALSPCITGIAPTILSNSDQAQYAIDSAFVIASLLVSLDASLATVPDGMGMTPLMLACMTRNTPMVNMLLETYNVPHDAVDMKKRSAFYYACLHGHSEGARALLDRYNDAISELVKASPSDFSKASCESGNTDIARLLLIEMGLPMPDFGRGKTPVKFACEKGFVELARFFLHELHLSSDVEDSDKSTILHMTCKQGHTSVARMIVKELGIDVNAVNKLGYTALHYACSKGKEECARFLVIECGAKVNVQAKQGSTPLILSVFKSCLPIASMLIMEGKAEPDITSNMGTALYVAVENNNVDLVRLLIGAGASMPDVECQADGTTALHLAASKGFVDIVRILLQEGNANPDLKLHTNRQTPLHHICSSPQSKQFQPDKDPVNLIISLLIRAKCDLNIEDKDGKMPIHHAIDNKFFVAVTILVKAGADVNAMTIDGHTPLTQCIEKNEDEFAEALIVECAANIHLRDNVSGMTPLLVASRVGRAHVVRLLLKNTLDVNQANDMGFTALHFAAHFSHQEVVKLLIASGADKSLLDDEGKTPADYAQIGIIEKLLSA